MRLQSIPSFKTVASFFLTFKNKNHLYTLFYCTYCTWQFHISRRVTSKQKQMRHERYRCRVCSGLAKSIQAILYPSDVDKVPWPGPDRPIAFFSGLQCIIYFTFLTLFHLYHKMTHFKNKNKRAKKFISSY